MARIRSVHPGLFTDSDWVECNLAARLLVIGLWTIADDQGVFVWRPKEIKMAVFPGDSIDIAPLLDDLSRNNLIRRYEAEGRSYGAIRNFRRWQRPQKPNALYPLPDFIAVYVGLKPSTTGPVHDPSATIPVNPIQREDGGGSKEEGEKVRVSNETLTPRARDDFSEFCELYPKPDKVLTAKPFWDAALSVAKPEAILAGLDRWKDEWRRRYGDEIRYIPSAYEWLASKSWTATPKPQADTAPPPNRRSWTGPPEIRTAVVAAESEAFAQNYLDQARWDPDQSRIITRTAIAADKLRKISELSAYAIERQPSAQEAA